MAPRPNRHAAVHLNGVRVGSLAETATGSRFTYAAEYLALPEARPVSWTLPRRAEPYDSPGLHPFFENLLPEGWLLDIALSKLKLSRADLFGMVCALCADCVGAVEITPEAAP